MNSENIIEPENTEDAIKTVEVNIELLKQLKVLMTIVSERIHWRPDELLPVGLLIKQLDNHIKE
jgi:hypothetical protein